MYVRYYYGAQNTEQRTMTYSVTDVLSSTLLGEGSLRPLALSTRNFRIFAFLLPKRIRPFRMGQATLVSLSSKTSERRVLCCSPRPTLRQKVCGTDRTFNFLPWSCVCVSRNMTSSFQVSNFDHDSPVDAPLSTLRLQKYREKAITVKHFPF